MGNVNYNVTKMKDGYIYYNKYGLHALIIVFANARAYIFIYEGRVRWGCAYSNKYIGLKNNKIFPLLSQFPIDAFLFPYF